MKHNFWIYIFILIFIPCTVYSQRIIFQSDFENLNLTIPDSLPAGWKKLDADSNFFGIGKSWAVRDTNQILGGDTIVNRPQAFSGKKALHISWLSGKGGSYISDDWVWTDSMSIKEGDSLIFKALLGNTKNISFYLDSVQIWICSAQSPANAHTHLATLKSNTDTVDNEWKEYKFSLSQFSSQLIYIAFRYYIPAKNALWCNIDDLFIGNRSWSVNIISGSSQAINYSLHQNYPNPFNSNTKIKFEIKNNFHNKQKVVLSLFNITGKEIVVILNENISDGIYEIGFDASSLESGIYFYRLTAGEFTQTRKMILLK